MADTLDGQFAVLARLMALAILRLEDGGEEAVRGSVALTESFIADMDAQMREEGFGDPSVGKQVRSMVGALAARSIAGAMPAAARSTGPKPCGSAFIVTSPTPRAPRPSLAKPCAALTRAWRAPATRRCSKDKSA